MKFILIILIVVSWLSGLYAYLMLPSPGSKAFDYIFPLVFVLNIFSGRYLYLKAKNKKLEWALFGLWGNFSAILIFWVWTQFNERWVQGKSLLSLSLAMQL